MVKNAEDGGIVNILRPVLDNLIGYDTIIFLVAAVTSFYYYFIRKHTVDVHDFLYGYRPDAIFTGNSLSKKEIAEQKNKLRKMLEESEKNYTMYLNLTAIFPLLGILGTVVALIPMVNYSMEASFFTALTSTLWGIIFAIIFKILDARLSPNLERNRRGIDEYLEKLDTLLEKPKYESLDVADALPQIVRVAE